VEEEVEEDPGEGTSSEPRKAKAETKRHEEDSDEEEISITVRRPLKMTEIQSSRNLNDARMKLLSPGCFAVGIVRPVACL